MTHFQSSGPFERPEQLEELLHEQGTTPEECANLLPILRRLPEWQAPRPSLADTRRLLARLTPELPVYSHVRQAIHEHRRYHIFWLLTVARAQVSLFGLSFWLVSVLITLVGAGVVLNLVSDQTLVGTRIVVSNPLLIQTLVLGVSGPLLAYLGTIVAFRGREARTLELELVCLPSPLQLTLARLVIVLGYDVCLGLALSLVFWAGGIGQTLALTLSWFMPLLMVTGLALLLSLRLSVQAAASVAYGSWLLFLAISIISPLQAILLTPGLLILPGCIGLVGLIIALFRLHNDMHHFLPYA